MTWATAVNSEKSIMNILVSFLLESSYCQVVAVDSAFIALAVRLVSKITVLYVGFITSNYLTGVSD